MRIWYWSSNGCSSNLLLFRAHQRSRTGDAIEAGVVDQDVERLLEHVEVQLLRHQADQAHRLVAAGMQVDAEHPHLARGLVHQRGDDADQGRLAGAVGAEQGVELRSEENTSELQSLMRNSHALF